MIVGNYGSGKTEVAVNLSLTAARSGRLVSIADLDIVNPYFRCREAERLLSEKGIRVVVPTGANAWADLPIILPQIRGLLHPAEHKLNILDVGGDEVGSRLLSSFFELLQGKPYSLWQVINVKRPFTDTVSGCLDMLSKIEKTSRLKVTGLVINTHLMDQTETSTILEGIELTKEVSSRSGLPIELLAVMDNLVDSYDWNQFGYNLLPMKRRMLPPWISRLSSSGESPPLKPVPIGCTQGAN